MQVECPNWSNDAEGERKSVLQWMMAKTILATCQEDD